MSNGFKLPLATIMGSLVILLFCVFTLASAARYPGPFTPMDNWLSDLGSPVKNPSGGVYFNIGCILTGACQLLLVAGLGVWDIKGGKIKAYMIIGQLSGAISAFGLMLIGVFTEVTAYHDLLSIVFFLFLVLFLAFVTLALWKHPKFLRWIGYYAVIVVVLELVFIYTYFAYAHAPFWEWLGVFSALLWVALLAYNTLKLD